MKFRKVIILTREAQYQDDIVQAVNRMTETLEWDPIGSHCVCPTGTKGVFLWSWSMQQRELTDK